MLHFMFAVKNGSEAFETFKAKFKNGEYKRDDISIKMMIDKLPSFTIEGKPDAFDYNYSQVCLIITPHIVNTSMLESALDHQKLFNKHFEDIGVFISETDSLPTPFVLIIGEEIVTSPVKYISTFGDELSALRNIGRASDKNKALIDLMIEDKNDAVRSCLSNPTYHDIGKVILNTLKVAILEFKTSGVTSSISDMIINGLYHNLLEGLPEEARTFFIRLICHVYDAFNHTTSDNKHEEYIKFTISIIEDFKFPNYSGTNDLAE